MSWESTLLYYRLINEYTRDARGGLHSAPCIVHSLDFAIIAEWQKAGRWEECGQLLHAMAKELESLGAEAIVLCTNTMHKVASAIESGLGIPLLHIVDATALQLQQQGIEKVLLLGTRYTMEDPFYRDRLRERFQIDALVPNEADRNVLHHIIYDELCLGKINPQSRDHCLRIIETSRTQGAQAVILGCTEITLLVQPQHLTLPIFDSTALHARAAVDWALS